MEDKQLKYESIADDVRKKIFSGEYEKNSQLPLEKEMCAKYKVSRITVKKAIDSLVNEGLVVKRRGSGSFVKDFDSYADERNIPNRLLTFSEIYKEENISTEILIFDIINPSPETAERLKIKSSDFVYRIGRVRKIDKEPICLEYSFIPINLVLGLSIVNAVDSIWKYIEDVSGIRIQSGHKEIYAGFSDEDTSKHLKLEIGSPILKINQIAFLETGQPIEYSHYLYPPEKFKYYTVDIR